MAAGGWAEGKMPRSDDSPGLPSGKGRGDMGMDSRPGEPGGADCEEGLQGTPAEPRNPWKAGSAHGHTPATLSPPDRISSHWLKPAGSQEGEVPYCILQGAAQANQQGKPGAACPGGTKDRATGQLGQPPSTGQQGPSRGQLSPGRTAPWSTTTPAPPAQRGHGFPRGRAGRNLASL